MFLSVVFYEFEKSATLAQQLVIDHRCRFYRIGHGDPAKQISLTYCIHFCGKLISWKTAKDSGNDNH